MPQGCRAPTQLRSGARSASKPKSTSASAAASREAIEQHEGSPELTKGLIRLLGECITESGAAVGKVLTDFERFGKVVQAEEGADGRGM